jgi:hypothetical protein
VDSPYYSESELFAGAVTVSFSKYLPWQAMHFLQRSTHFSKTKLRSFKKESSLDGGATLVECQRCAIEKWQWMRSPKSVEPH